MENLILASTAIDISAVAILAWLVLRSGRERDASLGVQRAALETLRAHLAELVADAERRAQALEETLGAREKRLRALLAELGRAEGGARTGAKAERPLERPLERPAAAAARPRSAFADLARSLGTDPAEARLLRDLEVRLPPKTA